MRRFLRDEMKGGEVSQFAGPMDLSTIGCVAMLLGAMETNSMK